MFQYAYINKYYPDAPNLNWQSYNLVLDIRMEGSVKLSKKL